MKTLANKKVYVAGKSAEIQKKAFELGCSWESGSQEINHTDTPFIFFQEQQIMATYSMSTFIESILEEITAEEILAMEVEKPEEKFYPFQKVLVRDSDKCVWHPNWFSRKDRGHKYQYRTLGDSGFKYCIDYESNKHLIFTTDKP